MLEHLFGSRTRVKLLSLFLRNPDEAIFVRELTRRISTQINAVRREIKNLVDIGLIEEIIDEEKPVKGKKVSATKKKYYRVNPNFTLLDELTALILRAQVMMGGRLDKSILELGDIRHLSLHGAFLGKQGSAPVDLFVVADRLPMTKLKALVVDAEKQLGFEINFTVMTNEEYRYRKDMTDRFYTRS
ncbi:MAG: hypothetical protein H6759_04180 [Candidatus Nomurabacteria bacterium]|nr:MAG: hypothetical protein H6759_04180 [Candidatus Nomurabacteria bacterium]